MPSPRVIIVEYSLSESTVSTNSSSCSETYINWIISAIMDPLSAKFASASISAPMDEKESL